MKAGLLLVAALALAGCDQNLGLDSGQEADEQALLDKVVIQDLLTRYYEGFGGSNPAAFNDFYTEDAVFDVNGIVANGKKEIEAIYAGLDEDTESPTNVGIFHMVVSNIVVDVDGDKATAKMLWTGIQNGDLRGPPSLVEQGREYDLLVKQNGQWLIKKRVVIADSGLPEDMVATYKQKLDYDITKD